jgi:5-methylcytosine-specific restriction endonuclease McrA
MVDAAVPNPGNAVRTRRLPMQTKPCSGCGEVKPATREFFGGTGTQHGGLRGRCRECEKVAKRAYEAANKDKRRIRDERRAKAGGGARRSFGLEFKQELLRKQNYTCLCCFLKISSADDAEVDHATPLSKGGRDSASNLFLAHAQCNKGKHGKTLPEHWDWRVRQKLDQESLGRKHGFLDLFSN